MTDCRLNGLRFIDKMKSLTSGGKLQKTLVDNTAYSKSQRVDVSVVLGFYYKDTA